MTNIILKIYDYIKVHKMVGLISIILLSVVLIIKLTSINYKEDISAFLPLDNNHQNSLKVYQDISGAGKIFAIFQYRDSTKQSDPDSLVEAVNTFAGKVTEKDKNGMVSNLTTQIDLEKINETSSFVYENIPYFLDEKDYQHIDSLLNDKDFFNHQLQQDKQMLLFPAGGLLSENIQRDPLNFFTPTVEKLRHTQSSLNYEMYDGYIFTPDMKKAIVMLSSPFGASETENNSKLVSLLNEVSNETSSAHHDIDVHIIGGPVIAVGNASQIKTDSIWAVSISIVLILILLMVCFRNIVNLLLIVVSIAWGWLFATGALAFVHNDISVIVIGISSVIIGIAVNYPLHLIAHLSHSPNMRTALKEIVAPLVVGNITTVAAFLCLVPLPSVALRDLGLFSSFLLIGTILFVLLYLPHVVKTRKTPVQNRLLNKISSISLESKPYVVVIVVILTLVFGWFSLDTKFDANMGHINYMTDEQKEDLNYFQKITQGNTSSQLVYIVSNAKSLDEALDKSNKIQPYITKLKNDGDIDSHSGCSKFLSSEKEQKRRLALWNKFIARHSEQIKQRLSQAGKVEGFADNSFDDFYSILDCHYSPQKQKYFSCLTNSVFSSNISTDSANNSYNVVDILTTKKTNVTKLEKNIDTTCPGSTSFDVVSMNSALANNLSSNFNYIGWACGLIVFFFLWFSFGSIELASLSFLPMAVSWIWILGLMSLFNIQFNIVNIILATFIFGQGDDYTIFMTEGSSYEYAYRKKMLVSYKNSIIISALIMFIGIGTLIIAKHPALHSLAEVTIVGMLSVVLMAYLFPPLIFKWLVKKNNEYRIRPIYLRPLFNFYLAALVFFTQLATVYVTGFILFVICHPNDKTKAFFHRYVQRLFNFDLRHMPNIKFSVKNKYNETFDKPTVIISNHQSMLDSACFMALNKKIIMVANKNASENKVIKKVFEWLDFYSLTVEEVIDTDKLQSFIDKGYSVVIFPEGERNSASSVLRFHKGAFYLADKMKLDILPVYLHGLNNVLPRNSVSLYPGSITINIGKRIKPEESAYGSTYVERTKNIHSLFIENYKSIAKGIENSFYYSPFVIDRYRYKGVECLKTVRHNMKKFHCYDKWIDKDYSTDNIMVLNGGYGEFALLFAITHPDKKVFFFDESEENTLLVKYCAEGIITNLFTLNNEEMKEKVKNNSTTVFILSPEKYSNEIVNMTDCILVEQARNENNK